MLNVCVCFGCDLLCVVVWLVLCMFVGCSPCECVVFVCVCVLFAADRVVLCV